MIELHTFPTPNSFKVSIALEELEVPYEIHGVNIARGEQFEPAFLAISPNNRIPAIIDREPAGGGEPVSMSAGLDDEAKKVLFGQGRRK